MESAHVLNLSIIDQALQENVWGISSSIDIYAFG